MLESYFQGHRAQTVQGQAGNGLQILVNEAIHQEQALGVWVMFIMVIAIEVNVSNCDNGIVEFQPYFHIKSLSVTGERVRLLLARHIKSQWAIEVLLMLSL